MKFFRKSDIVIILVILIVGAVFWTVYNQVYANKPAKAEIYYGSELIKTVELTKGVDQRFSIPQNSHVIFHQFPDGSIKFEESNCPDKICVKTGKLNKVGETAACLPNKIFLKIVSSGKRGKDDVDMVVGG